MVEFVGYNDARAIKAYNKKNLTRLFIWFGIICSIVSVVALIIPAYELLFIWGLYLFLRAICLFAMSFSKYDDRALKESNIKTKHIFSISDLKLYRDGKEIKNTKNIRVFSYKTYIFLECKKSYYYIPLGESNPAKDEIKTALYEVIYQIDIGKEIAKIKNFVESNNIDGEFTYTHNSIIWVSGNCKYTYHLDSIEVYVTKDELNDNRIYKYITHYHIPISEIIEDIRGISQEFDSI